MTSNDPAAPGRPQRVLFADDNLDMRVLIRVWVEAEAEVAAEAVNGVEALKMWRAERDAGRRVDLLVLDQMMPEMTGLEAAKVVLGEDPSARVVLFTAAPTYEVRHEAQAAGLLRVVDKGKLHGLLDVLTTPVAA